MTAPPTNVTQFPVRTRRWAPIMNCPVCNEASKVRSSEEITPTLRMLYYFCPNVHCGMTWKASLQFEDILSPSGISNDFRPPKVRADKPPGHDFGQVSLLDLIGPDKPG